MSGVSVGGAYLLAFGVRRNALELLLCYEAPLAAHEQAQGPIAKQGRLLCWHAQVDVPWEGRCKRRSAWNIWHAPRQLLCSMKNISNCSTILCLFSVLLTITHCGEL